MKKINKIFTIVFLTIISSNYAQDKNLIGSWIVKHGKNANSIIEFDQEGFAKFTDENVSYGGKYFLLKGIIAAEMKYYTDQTVTPNKLKFVINFIDFDMKEYTMLGLYRYLKEDKIELRLSTENLVEFTEFSDSLENTLILEKQ